LTPAPLPQAPLDAAQRLACLRLIRSDNVGPVTFRELINHFGGAEPALAALPELSRRGGRQSIRICPEAHARAELEAADRIGARPLFTIEPGYPPALAAMLMYLNRTAFNGLFRLNASGGFNVPVGRYTNPRIVDRELVDAASAALRRRAVSIELAPFERALERAERGDFLYFDPPYAPMSATARFTSYTNRPFGLEDQARLRDAAVELASRGCHVMVSNSSAPEIAELYQHPRVTRAGLRLHQLPARRSINSRGSARGPIVEFLLTNLTERRGAQD